MQANGTCKAAKGKILRQKSLIDWLNHPLTNDHTYAKVKTCERDLNNKKIMEEAKGEGKNEYKPVYGLNGAIPKNKTPKSYDQILNDYLDDVDKENKEVKSTNALEVVTPNPNALNVFVKTKEDVKLETTPKKIAPVKATTSKSSPKCDTSPHHRRKRFPNEIFVPSQVTPVLYRDFNNNVIWPNSTNTAFNDCLAGIGLRMVEREYKTLSIPAIKVSNSFQIVRDPVKYVCKWCKFETEMYIVFIAHKQECHVWAII